jgi:antitoxin HicB
MDGGGGNHPRAMMVVMKFTVILAPETEGGYSVICPAISGCVSQGDSLEEALANIREAILLCLEVRKDEEIRVCLRERAEEDLPLTLETREVEVEAGVAVRCLGFRSSRAAGL